MQFADRLQNYRKQRGLSQENLAELVGVSRQAVSKWESGQTYPDIDKLVVLSELFGVSVDHLLKGGERETVQPEERAAVEDDSPIPHLSNAHWRSLFHYEYKSRTTLFGVPLVHINVGRGLYVAKGIIAVGTIAIGAVSVGAVALGGICLGALALGLFSIAALAVGLLLGAGGLALGTVAVGGVAVGVAAIGGVAIGMFSLGGCAIASHIAIGGYANGHIAIGDTARGAYTFITQDGRWSSIPAGDVKELIHQEYPRLWKPLVDWITAMFG